MAATDWVIDGTLLDVTGQPLDLSNAELTWTLIGPDGLPALQNGDASISIVDSTNGIIPSTRCSSASATWSRRCGAG